MDEQSELHDGGISKEEKEAILTKSKKHKNFKEEKKAEDMPEGWILHIHKRPKHIDRYWFTPKTCKRLRSRPEVKRFLECLKKCNDDEDRAWDLFKSMSHRISKGRRANQQTRSRDYSSDECSLTKFTRVTRSSTRLNDSAKRNDKVSDAGNYVWLDRIEQQHQQQLQEYRRNFDEIEQLNVALYEAMNNLDSEMEAFESELASYKQTNSVNVDEVPAFASNSVDE
mmetsp:Transcript_18653/g.21553  ORF Transcript_18653/g.21553 Transcript_18653/m.21553 type:complete len:226 (-) Transcript_18653:33-710(-)